jgi:ribosomal protein S27E
MAEAPEGFSIDAHIPEVQLGGGGGFMTQPQLKQLYIVVTVVCSHCQQKQVVHVQAGSATWSEAHQLVRCLICGQDFEANVSEAIIGGPYLP